MNKSERRTIEALRGHVKRLNESLTEASNDHLEAQAEAREADTRITQLKEDIETTSKLIEGLK